MEINIVGNYGGFSTLAGTPIQGATVTITGQMVWSGTTDALGKAKDINGSVPELVYGPYSVVTTKSGYTDGSGSFVVPDTTSLTKPQGYGVSASPRFQPWERFKGGALMCMHA